MAFLPFWRWAAVVARCPQGYDLFTPPLITRNFVEVVAALRVDAPILGNPLNSTMDVSPQVSNDMVNWEDVTPGFTQITPASAFPFIEFLKVTEVGWFMRFKIRLVEPGGNLAGATLSLMGDGKLDHEERESRKDFLNAVFGAQLGGTGVMPLPASPYKNPVSKAPAPTRNPGGPGGMYRVGTGALDAPPAPSSPPGASQSSGQRRPWNRWEADSYHEAMGGSGVVQQSAAPEPGARPFHAGPPGAMSEGGGAKMSPSAFGSYDQRAAVIAAHDWAGVHAALAAAHDPAGTHAYLMSVHYNPSGIS